MANIFTSDSSCVALWTFEAAPGFLLDSTVNSNDLTNTVVASSGVQVKEGIASAYFNGTAQLSIPDTSCSTYFPFRFFGTPKTKDATISFWIYFSDLPSNLADNLRMFSKYDSGANKRVFLLYFSNANDRLNIIKGYNNGASSEIDTYGTTVQINTWYHVDVGYRESDKSYYMSIFDDTAGTLLGSIIIDNFVQTTDLKDVDLEIDSSKKFLGYLDEYVIFNRKKTLSDIDKIRSGTYNWKDFGNLSLNLNTQLNMLGGG